MSADLFTQRQYQEAATDDEAAAVRAHIEAAVVDVHTAGPGIVKSFDASKQTAVVQPVVQKFFRGQGFKPLPDLMDVPVQFPRGGGFVLTFPVSPGDECLLVFAERAIDHWYDSGGVQPPSDFRTHSLSDAFAFVGVSSSPHVVPDFNASAVELRSLNGAAKVQIDGGGNLLISSDAGSVTVKSGQMTNLNAPPGALPLTNGVVLASLVCPFAKMTHGALAAAAGGTGVALKVVAG